MRLEHLLSEEMQKEEFETQLDRSASEGQASQREHLLSEEIQMTWISVLRGSQEECLFRVLQFSGLCKQYI